MTDLSITKRCAIHHNQHQGKVCKEKHQYKIIGTDRDSVTLEVDHNNTICIPLSKTRQASSAVRYSIHYVIAQDENGEPYTKKIHGIVSSVICPLLARTSQDDMVYAEQGKLFAEINETADEIEHVSVKIMEEKSGDTYCLAHAFFKTN